MRKLYSAIQMLFLSVALSAVGSVITNIASLQSMGNLMTIAGGIMTIVALYSLRFENQHFSKSLRLFWISAGMILLMSVIAAVALVSLNEDTSLAGAIAMAVAVIITGIAAVVLEIMTQYQFYKGLDVMREARAIDYPAKKIMWCFYLAIISMIISLIAVLSLMPSLFAAGEEAAASSVLAVGNVLLVVSVVMEAIHLWLIFTYMQATREALEQEQSSGWG